MRARTPRRAALLVAMAAFAAAALTAGGASANHSPPVPLPETHIGQAGNDHESLPVIRDFTMLSVSFDPFRFPITLPQGGVVARPGFQRYLGYGLLRVPSPTGPTGVFASQLAMVRSEDGIHWSTPQRATIRDPETGEDVPFIMNEPQGAYLDVVFAKGYIYPTTGMPQGEIQIYYAADETYPWVMGNNDIFDIGYIHNALSDDGVTFYDDISIAQDAFVPVVSGNIADFNGGSNGPTDVIHQPGKSDDEGCSAVDPDAGGPLLASPWNCRWVMLYDAVQGAGTIESIGIASSYDGITWRGFIDPVTSLPRALIPAGAAGTWDDNAATNATVRIRPNLLDARFPYYDIYYSGGQLPDTSCYAGTAGCWSLGTAFSPGDATGQGLNFTKTALNPVTPKSLLENFPPVAPFPVGKPYTLWKPMIMDDAGTLTGNGGGHASLFYTRVTNGNGSNLQTASRDVFRAFTEPAPEQKPRIRISNPVGPYRNDPDTPLEFYITDTLGTTPAKTAIDATTLVVKLDGIVQVGGWTPVFPHLVTALTNPATKFSAPSGYFILPDGVHTFEVSIADYDGNVATASTSFILDTTAPVTTLSATPDDPAIGYPLTAIGTFAGAIVEGTATTGTAIDRIDAYVTNPLGQQKVYEIKGGLVTKTDAKHWTWAWVVPSMDPHLLIPGTYTFSFRAADIAANREDPTVANTADLMVIL